MAFFSITKCIVRKIDVQKYHPFQEMMPCQPHLPMNPPKSTCVAAKAMIERAATLWGTTVSSFMLQNAFEAARRIVSETDTLLSTQRDFEAFTASIEYPSKSKVAL
jgi:hypothetical protein